MCARETLISVGNGQDESLRVPLLSQAMGFQGLCINQNKGMLIHCIFIDIREEYMGYQSAAQYTHTLN